MTLKNQGRTPIGLSDHGPREHPVNRLDELLPGTGYQSSTDWSSQLDRGVVSGGPSTESRLRLSAAS
jgi:hypothetical protein